MARNGSGTYNRAVSPYTAGTTITAATVNQEMDDIATALTGSMARDGQSPATANIPMGGNRITGLANAVANTDAATLGQVDGRAEVDLASAGTTDIGAAASNNVRITGTTTITSFGTAANGVTRELRFAGALTLTHNATSLFLPGAANIITAAGDTATVVSLGSGNWVVTAYQRALSFGINLGASVSSTSGSSIDFTGIPAGVRRVTAMFSGLSTNGTLNPGIRLGTSGGIATTGYDGTQNIIDTTIAGTNLLSVFGGFPLGGSIASNLRHGKAEFVRLTGNTWVGTLISALSNSSAIATAGGSITLAGELDRLRFTTGGADTFDAGTVNESWEF